jgi:hypothetical protein
MLLLREIIMLCLDFSIKADDIDRLEVMVQQWVMQYEA